MKNIWAEQALKPTPRESKQKVVNTVSSVESGTSRSLRDIMQRKKYIG